MLQLAILASGNGSNAKKIIEFFKDHEAIRVALVISNNPSAGVLSIANNHEIPIAIFNKKTIDEQEFVRATLVSFDIDFLVLAGFMIKLPSYFSLLFPKRMLNIHPALLPKYGGKGMFGIHVHEAVFHHKEKETGIEGRQGKDQRKLHRTSTHGYRNSRTQRLGYRSGRSGGRRMVVNGRRLFRRRRGLLGR
jgi:phosphoribosylglycinamide formyltransferase-1